MCYFANAYNRNKLELTINLEELIKILQLHESRNTALYELLIENDNDLDYILLFGSRSLLAESSYWLKKMDFVFRFIIWIY